MTMGITGAHVLLYTPEPEALRATLRDVFGWRHVDAGGGWLIFALPPAELKGGRRTMGTPGAPSLFYTRQPEALRALPPAVLGWGHVAAGGGCPILARPPAERGVRPAEGPTYESGVRRQFTLMCDDIA